jgi:general stress protein 26
MPDENSDARKKLWTMISKHRFAMMTSRQGDTLRSRPMTTIDREGETLWFFAKADSAVAEALERTPQVCLSYSDGASHDFVCVAGDAMIVRDSAKKKELWSPAVQVWMPEGAESPQVVLIEVMPDHAEYWDSSSSKIVHLFSAAKALATGRPPSDVGEHREVPMRRG